MSASAYYRRETRRHPDVVAARLTLREAKKLTWALIREHDLDVVKVTRLRLRARHTGVFKPIRRLIAYKRTGVSLLTVLHEVAHAIDWKLHPGPTRRRRWHCKRHAEIVDDLARIAKERGWHRRTA